MPQTFQWRVLLLRPRTRTIATATAFVEETIRHNVLIIPGSVFSDRDTNFRLSYATSNENLARGCDILCQLARG